MKHSKNIKVLFLTYPRIGLNLGGLEIQIQKTAEALSKLDVEVIFYDPWRNQIPDIDICHVFSLEGTLVYHVQRAISLGKPVVISPVFNSFSGLYWQTIIKAKLGKYIPGVYSDLKRALIMLSNAHKILALNTEEKKFIQNAFSISPSKFAVVPNGINSEFSKGNPALFEKKIGVKNFILQVASINKNKNQLNLIKAIKMLPYKLVIIGKTSDDNYEYLNECQALANDNIYFVGQLANDDPLLASAFAAAKLFVLPSYSEVMPLSLYEAALAGCQLATSNRVTANQNIKPYITIFDPDNPVDIARKIDQAMQTNTVPEIREKALLMPSWQDIAVIIKNIYDDSLINRQH